MKREYLKRAVITVSLAILIAVILTILSAVPPLSLIYQWAERKNLECIWYGLVAGIIAFCLILFGRTR